MQFLHRKIIYRLTPAPDFQYAYDGINFAVYIYIKLPPQRQEKLRADASYILCIVYDIYFRDLTGKMCLKGGILNLICYAG